MNYESTDDALEDTAAGVVVKKDFEAEDFPVPAIRFAITSERDEAVTVRISDDIPDGFSMDGIGFHPDYEGENWTAYQDQRVEYERTLQPGEQVVTVYGIRASTMEEVQAFLVEPRIADVKPAGADVSGHVTDVIDDQTIQDIAPKETNQVVRDVLSGKRESVPGMEGTTDPGVDSATSDESSETDAGHSAPEIDETEDESEVEDLEFGDEDVEELLGELDDVESSDSTTSNGDDAPDLDFDDEDFNSETDDEDTTLESEVEAEDEVPADEIDFGDIPETNELELEPSSDEDNGESHSSTTDSSDTGADDGDDLEDELAMDIELDPIDENADEQHSGGSDEGDSVDSGDQDLVESEEPLDVTVSDDGQDDLDSVALDLDPTEDNEFSDNSSDVDDVDDGAEPEAPTLSVDLDAVQAASQDAVDEPSGDEFSADNEPVLDEGDDETIATEDPSMDLPDVESPSGDSDSFGDSEGHADDDDVVTADEGHGQSQESPPSVAAESGATTLSGDPTADSTSGDGEVVTALIDELQSGGVHEDDLDVLRGALGVEQPDQPIRSVETRLQRLESRMEEFDAYTDALREFIDERGTATEIIDDLESEFADVKDEMATLSNTVEDSEATVESVGEVVSVLESDLSSVSDDVEQFTDRIQDLETTAGGNADSVETLSGSIENLETELEMVDAVVENVESDISELESTLQSVETVMDEQETQLSDVAADFESAENGLQSDLDRMRGDIEALQAEVQDIVEWRGQLGEMFK